MIKKQMRRCRSCRCFFEICKKVKKHEYCNKKECQNARKRKWQRDKIRNDEVYKKDQEEAQEDWVSNNPDYWGNYRQKNPEYTDRNRKRQLVRNQKRKAKSALKTKSQSIAKMDALTSENKIISGKYELVPFKSDMIAKMDALIVEINAVSRGYADSGP